MLVLLAHSADRNAVSRDGLTAADIARKYGKEFSDWFVRDR